MILDDLAMLVSGTASGTLGVDLYTARMPEAPDALCVIDVTGGVPPEFVQERSSPAYETVVVQIVARDLGEGAFDRAYSRALAAYTRLAMIENSWIGGTFYQRVWPQQPPFPMGRDQADRIHIGFSCRVVKGPDA